MASLATWQGRVRLQKDPWGEAYIVSYDITHEQERICGYDSVELVFDDAGGGALVCGGGGGGADPDAIAYKVLGDVLQLSLYCAGDGRDFVLRAGSEQPERLSDASAHFLRLDLQATCGPQRFPRSFDVGMLKAGEYFGLRLRFSLLVLYTKLGLQSHRGQRWNWVGKNWSSWSRFLCEALPRHGFALLKGTSSSKNSRPLSEAPVVLSCPSCSTAALIALLSLRRKVAAYPSPKLCKHRGLCWMPSSPALPSDGG